MIFDSVTVRAFEEYHKDNPHVFSMFERFALEAAKHRKKYSACDIVSRIRWWYDVDVATHDGFKINNNWAAFYSRMFTMRHPELGRFFLSRRSIADDWNPL